MSVETDKLPPVPQHDPPIDKGGIQERFTASWMRWFLQVKAKVDVINESVANLSRLIGDGLAVKDTNGEWQARSIAGTANRISVTNGDGQAGDPTVDIDAAYAGQASINTLGTVTTGTWEGDPIAVGYGGTGATDAATARDNLGAAAKMETTSTSATGGAASALPALPVGYVEVVIGGAAKKIPYYD